MCTNCILLCISDSFEKSVDKGDVDDLDLDFASEYVCNDLFCSLLLFFFGYINSKRKRNIKLSSISSLYPQKQIKTGFCKESLLGLDTFILTFLNVYLLQCMLHGVVIFENLVRIILKSVVMGLATILDITFF